MIKVEDRQSCLSRRRLGAWTGRIACPPLLLLLIACHESSLPTASNLNDPRPGVAVTGRVLDYTSSVPMAGLEVVIGNARATTDANGRYAISVPAGDYPVTIAGGGVGIIVPRGASYDADFLINGGTCRSRYGRVYDANTGRPVAGATITLSKPVTSGIDGAYRIDLGCDPANVSGTGFMDFSHPAYHSAQVPFREEYLAPPFRVDVALVPR